MPDIFGLKQAGRATVGGRFYATPTERVEAGAIYVPNESSPLFGVAEYPVEAGSLGAFTTEGTFVFDVNTYGGTPREDAATLCYSGMTDVQDGTLVVSENAISNFVGRTFRVAGVLDMSGQTLADAVLATAGGTIRNAALSEPRFVVGFDGEGEALPVVLDYANGFTMSGRVVFDFGAETGAPYAKGTVMTVARWTGAQKPDISRWRAVNVGEGLKCLFDAKDDGTITARIVSGSGLVLFVR